MFCLLVCSQFVFTKESMWVVVILFQVGWDVVNMILKLFVQDATLEDHDSSTRGDPKRFDPYDVNILKVGNFCLVTIRKIRFGTKRVRSSWNLESSPPRHQVAQLAKSRSRKVENPKPHHCCAFSRLEKKWVAHS